jgi:hypothetical protein
VNQRNHVGPVRFTECIRVVADPVLGFKAFIQYRAGQPEHHHRRDKWNIGFFYEIDLLAN